MLEKICQLSPAMHGYLAGDEGSEASKRSTQWLQNITLPPRYGIVSTNISESSSSLCMKKQGNHRGCTVGVLS
jgi:hypothetical protein